MAEKLKLPMGIEDFERIRKDGFYYVDKTRLVRDLLEHMALVNLFTRPRRFGKTLNMSMLKHFFEIGSDKTLFDGLEISREKELCSQYMGKFPIISISLKNAASDTFDETKAMLRSIIGQEALRFSFLAESSRLSETERKQYKAMTYVDDDGIFTMKDSLLKSSLMLLSCFLQKHYGQKVIILIDEYDVPLDQAYRSGYYDAMTELVRAVFGAVLKTNNSLYFAVLTGCLKISKESIFTGLNNFNVYTISDVQYNEYFGFTDSEVRGMLGYYGHMGKYDAVREWYDGYRFGELSVYCPWDVVSHCHALKMNLSIEPQNYWVNTSSNDIIRRFLDRADATTKDEIEFLISGGHVKKKIHQELTYRDLDSKMDNLWSVLFTTGYLTPVGADIDGMVELAIPNKEILWIFTEQIQEWHEREVQKDIRKLDDFCTAFKKNDIAAIEDGFSSYLNETISIRDTNVKKEMKENFYHGILLGLLGNMRNWVIKSNAEAGEGYSDISIEIKDEKIGIVIELKYAENASFDSACQKALRQIREKNYGEKLIDDGMKMIYQYGVACYKKRCKVMSELILT